MGSLSLGLNRAKPLPKKEGDAGERRWLCPGFAWRWAAAPSPPAPAWLSGPSVSLGNHDPSRTPRRDAAVYTQACVAALAPPCYVENLMNLFSKKNAG